MSSTPLYYRPSGRFGGVQAIGTFAAGAAAAIVLGALYGALLYYSPIIYLNVAALAAFGYSIGWVVGRCAKAFHIRNVSIVMVLGLACGLIAEHVQFVAWVFVLSDLQALILDPVELVSVLVELAQIGVWSIGSSSTPVSGVALYAFWFAEAAVILGCAALVPAQMIRTSQFCETCQRWLDESKTLLPFAPIADAAGTRAKLERGEFGVLGDLEAVSDEAMQYSKIRLQSCTRCDQLHLMSMHNVAESIDSKGRSTKTETPVVVNLLIDRPTRDLMEQILPSISNEEQKEESDGSNADTSDTAAEEQAT